MSAELLKGFQVRQNQIEIELNHLCSTLRDLQKQIDDKKNSLNHIKREIFELINQKPMVTEHAMLRYIERVLKINLKDIENKILSERNLKIIDQLKSGKIPMEGCKLIVKNKAVITVEI
jgi:archaellum component FlaC